MGIRGDRPLAGTAGLGRTGRATQPGALKWPSGVTARRRGRHFSNGTIRRTNGRPVRQFAHTVADFFRSMPMSADILPSVQLLPGASFRAKRSSLVLPLDTVAAVGERSPNNSPAKRRQTGFPTGAAPLAIPLLHPRGDDAPGARADVSRPGASPARPWPRDDWRSTCRGEEHLRAAQPAMPLGRAGCSLDREATVRRREGAWGPEVGIRNVTKAGPACPGVSEYARRWCGQQLQVLSRRVIRAAVARQPR